MRRRAEAIRPSTRPLIKAYNLPASTANAARLLKEQIEDEEKAITARTEEKRQFWQMYMKMNDNAGYTSALEKLVDHYPKKSYWADLISRYSEDGLHERLELDVLRLQLATGT